MREKAPPKDNKPQPGILTPATDRALETGYGYVYPQTEEVERYGAPRYSEKYKDYDKRKNSAAAQLAVGLTAAIPSTILGVHDGLDQHHSTFTKLNRDLFAYGLHKQIETYQCKYAVEQAKRHTNQNFNQERSNQDLGMATCLMFFKHAQAHEELHKLTKGQSTPAMHAEVDVIMHKILCEEFQGSDQVAGAYLHRIGVIESRLAQRLREGRNEDLSPEEAELLGEIRLQPEQLALIGAALRQTFKSEDPDIGSPTQLRAEMNAMEHSETSQNPITAALPVTRLKERLAVLPSSVSPALSSASEPVVTPVLTVTPAAIARQRLAALSTEDTTSPTIVPVAEETASYNPLSYLSAAVRSIGEMGSRFFAHRANNPSEAARTPSPRESYWSTTSPRPSSPRPTMTYAEAQTVSAAIPSVFQMTMERLEATNPRTEEAPKEQERPSSPLALC